MPASMRCEGFHKESVDEEHQMASHNACMHAWMLACGCGRAAMDKPRWRRMSPPVAAANAQCRPTLHAACCFASAPQARAATPCAARLGCPALSAAWPASPAYRRIRCVHEQVRPV
eukprot:356379-Chlamydomonas_euryale.AAC.1